jgi:predicted dehydrogenase
MSNQKIRWGVLGAAGIALKKVIPAMQLGEVTEVTGIASRDLAKAKDAAARLGIRKTYSSYEDLLADPEIDAVYNPLPNHLHAPWTIQAASAGKHVLCEKPIALKRSEVAAMIEARDRNRVKIGEAFMVRTHPQWLRARQIVKSGEIGAIRGFLGAFSYFNDDPYNIRNVASYGGGGLMDIGCYPIFTSRFVLGEEPKSVIAAIDRDPTFHTDRLTSAILDYPSAQANFCCSTQMTPYQRIQILGTAGRVEIEIPFNAPPDRPTRLFVDTTGDLSGSGVRTESFPVCDQYTLQGDAFSRAILNNTEVPVPLEDALRNLAVIEALFRSTETGHWEVPIA